MEFLNPAGLFALALLPLLLIPYILRRKRRIAFSSVQLLKELSVGSSNRSWARLRLPLLFFLQLFFLTLLALGLGDPVSTARWPEKIAVVLDNSASMQTMEGTKSRFDIARERARGLLGNLHPDSRLSLFLTVPGLDAIGKDLNPAKAMELMEPLQAYDLGEPQGEYEQFLSLLSAKGGYDRVYFFTDYRARSASESIKVVSLGEPQENLAISSLDVTRSLASGRLQATAEVTNFGSKVRQFKLSLKGDGRTIATELSTVAPGKTTTIFFEGLPYRSFYEAQLAFGDALPLDNLRYAVLPAVKGLSVLGISPTKGALQSLGKIPGLQVRVIDPHAYQRNDRGRQRLEIFHYSAPQVLPQNDALFVLPPKKNPLVALGKPQSTPAITDWRDPHPLTRYVNFALLRPTYARPVVPPLLANTIIEGPAGPLAVVVRHRGYRYLVLGFDPFPYLAQANLPMSVFTLNLLNWFFAGLEGSTTVTGEPLSWPGHKGITLVDPSGQTADVSVGNDSFSRTFLQGIYRVVEGTDEKVMWAVNFNNPSESDLSRLPELNLREVAGDDAPRTGTRRLWIYFVLVSVLVLLFEWFFNLTASPVRFSMARFPGDHST